MKAALAAAAGLATLTITGAVLAEAGRTGKGLSEKAQVFVVDRGGDGLRQLTSDGHDHSGLTWSPRGHRLATSFSSGIQVLSPETGRVRTFRAPNVTFDGPIAWSPDGRLIAYETTYDNRHTGAIDARLKTLAVRTGKRRVLADPATDQPSWAPGGRSLVYVKGDVVGVAPDACTPPPDRPPDSSCHPEKPATEEVRTVGRDGRHGRRLVRNASSQFARAADRLAALQRPRRRDRGHPPRWHWTPRGGPPREARADLGDQLVARWPATRLHGVEAAARGLAVQAPPHVAGHLAHPLLQGLKPERLALALLLPRPHEDQSAARARRHHARRHHSRPAARVAQGARVPLGQLVHGGVGDRREPALEPLAQPLRRLDRHQRAAQKSLNLAHRPCPP
jgi:hypothetical protein